MIGVVRGAVYAYPFRAPDFTSDFHRGTCCPATCVSLFHVIVLSFGFWVLFHCIRYLYICCYMRLSMRKKRKDVN